MNLIQFINKKTEHQRYVLACFLGFIIGPAGTGIGGYFHRNPHRNIVFGSGFWRQITLIICSQYHLDLF
jgi:hypothetical protein